MVGGSDQLVSDGSCLVVDPQGSVVASACSFDEDLVLFARETFAGDQHERHVNETSSGYSALIPGFPDPSKAAGTDKEKLAVFRKVRDDIRKRFHEYDETEIKKGR